jgi:hypothetical protein
MEPIETIEHRGYKIKIYPDELLDVSPRDWGNLCTMTCFHKRYALGDDHNLEGDSFTGWDEVEEHLVKDEDAYIIHPLFMYDHSGLAIRMGHGFGDIDAYGWDWGQIGFIWVTRNQILEWFDVKRVTKAIREKAKEAMAAEVVVYDSYVRGEVYGYDIDPSPKVTLGLCWGFYGADYEKSGLLDSARQEIDDELQSNI